MTAAAGAVVGWQSAGPGQRILRWWWRAPRLTRGLGLVARRPDGFGTGTTGTTGTGPGAGLPDDRDRDRDRVGRQQRRKGKCPGRQQQKRQMRMQMQTQTERQRRQRHPQRNPCQQQQLGRSQERQRAQPIQPGVVEIGCLVWLSDRKALS